MSNQQHQNSGEDSVEAGQSSGQSGGPESVEDIHVPALCVPLGFFRVEAKVANDITPTPIEYARQAVRDALQLARSARERVDAVKVENRQRIVDAKQDAQDAEEAARAVIGNVLANLAFSGDLDAFMGPKARKASDALEEAIAIAERREQRAAEARMLVLAIASGKAVAS